MTEDLAAALNGKSVLYERLVSSSDSRVDFSCVCSLVEGRTHLVLSHGGSLSVREVRKNHVELVASFTTPASIVFLSVIRRAGRGVIFLLLATGVVKLMGLARSGGTCEVFENWSRSLEWPAAEVQTHAVVCKYDEQRCAIVVFAPVEPTRVTEVSHGKKRSVVARDNPPLVFLLRFSFDKYPKILTKIDSIKWKFDWAPNAVSFLRAANEAAPWSFGCSHPVHGVKTFAVKFDGSVCDFRELKLSFVPPAPVCDLHFVEGTTLLVGHPSELALYAGAKLVVSVKYDAAVSSVRIFPLTAQSAVVSLSDGSLHLATVGPGNTLTSLYVGACAGRSMATTLAHLSTVTFKQGPCFLVFIGCAIGDSSIAFIVPSNPKRRLQHLVQHLSLAPVSGLVPAPSHRRVYASFGIGNDSGLASLERLFRYRCMMHFPAESVVDAYQLGDARCAIALAESTRVVQLTDAGSEECRVVEQVFPHAGRTLAMWLLAERENNLYVRVTPRAVQLMNDSFAVISEVMLQESEAVSAVSDCSYNSKSPSVMVLCKDAHIRRFLFDATFVSLYLRGSVALPNFSESQSQLVCVGFLQNMLIAISNGVLHSDQCKFGVRWEPFPVRSLTGKTVVAIAVSQHKNIGEAPFVYVAALCHSSPNPRTRNWYMVIFAFWLISPSTSASDAVVFLFAEDLENGSAPLVVGTMRFTSDTRFKHCVSVDVSGTVYVVVQNLQDAWTGLRAADEFAPLVTLALGSDKKVTLLSSLSGAGLALAWQGEVSYIPSLLYRHTATLRFLAAFPELALLVALDDRGKMLALHTNQLDPQTRRMACQKDVFIVPEGAIVSDMQRVVDATGATLLAISYARAPPADSEQRLVYHSREIVFLSVASIFGAAVVSAAPGLGGIPWPGTGSCQLQFRSLSAGRLVAACDAQVRLFSVAPNATKQLLSTDLRSGNDIVSSLSVQGPMVTISHLFGSLVALKCSSTGEFEASFKAGASRATDGPVSLMLSEDVCVASSSQPFATVLACVGNKLVSVARVTTEGPVCAAMYERAVGFFGTTTGELYAVRVLSADVTSKLLGKAESGVYDFRSVRLAMDNSVMTLPKNLEDLVTWM